MLIQNFTVKLLENVVLSQRAATVGGHASLDYLPGASFLGATAASLYKELSQADAYTVFFSGKVRFGNAFPLSQNNRLSYPMPLCWHERKTGDKAIQDNKLVQKHVLNYIHEKFPLDVQPVQLRTGYIAKDGSVTRITTEFKMKTAINSKTGRASEGQLFGYSSIPKGMNFGFKLEADQDVSQALFQKVINHLTGNLAIGRSRSAEYGNVKVTTDSTWFEDHQDKEVKKKEITIWLLSDLALLDEFGQSTLLPTTQHFGLPQGNLILEKCFIRSRHYAPFNGHYCRRELERTVLSMGSILYFELTEESQFTRQQMSIGLYRQAGLGQILINPSLLETEHPEFEKIEKRSSSFKKKAPKQPDLPLARWLSSQVDQSDQTQKIQKQAKDWTMELNGLYNSARSLAAVKKGIRVGPSPSQWGRVLDFSTKPNITKKDICDKLFNNDNGICKEGDPEWCAAVPMKQTQARNFREWLMNKIDKTPDNELAALLGHLAKQAMNIAREQENKT